MASFDVQGAKKAGYSDAEIADFMASQSKFDAAGARKSGYSDADIIGHLSGAPAKPAQKPAAPKPATKAKPDTAKDVAKSGATGVGKGIRNMLAPVFDGSLQGAVSNALGKAGASEDLRAAFEAGSPLGMFRNAENILGLRSGTTRRAVEKAPSRDYVPQTRAGRYAESVGENVVNAAAPGGPVRRVASVVLPGVMGEGARETASALGAGETGQRYAKLAGNVLGGLAASATLPQRAAAGPARYIPRQDPAAMQQRAQEYRDAGIDPTLIDVVDDSARGTVRAAASRNTPGRQMATDFQDARQLDLPSRMGGQARRVMSQDPRTPDQIREALAADRGQNAAAQFGAVRGETIPLAQETVQALRTDYGRRAIQEAASRERDPEVRAALNRLYNDAFDNPGGTQITIGMADRVSRVLNGQAQAAGRSGDNELAGLLRNLGESIRNPARQASPGYAQALEDYGASSRLMNAADVGENMLTRNTDEFTVQAQNLTPEERNLALAAGRRAIERKAGESTGSAPGVARQIANAPEQQARNAALMGPERAGQLQQGMRLEERSVRNANDIAPRFGSQTQNKAQDAAQLARGAQQLARGDYIGIGIDFLRSRGMNDRDAEGLVRMALDPQQTDRAIQIIGQRYGQQAAQQAIDWRRAALLAAPGAMAASAQTPAQ